MTATTTTIPAIERTLDLRAAPDRVWSALTDAGELVRWFGDRADFRADVGYAGWMEFEGHGRVAMLVEEVDPPRRLAVRWGREPDAELGVGSTLVEWDLEPLADGGTRLHLRESGFADPAGRTGNTAGWLSELGELVALLGNEPFERGIRKTWQLTSPVERVWEAFADPDQFRVWWAGDEPPPLVVGHEGWWVWPWEGLGRFGMRIDVVEPPTYLAWTWTPVPDVPIADATVLLHTQWSLERRDDGGTTLSLLETGFTEPEGYGMNDGGWDGNVIPALRRVLGETSPD
jgi:uncharacterized protein YndB with AHSA1/START domain